MLDAPTVLIVVDVRNSWAVARDSASATLDEISIIELSASCVDSQFPADPRFAGGLVTSGGSRRYRLFW
jgi:hypothetical protein